MSQVFSKIPKHKKTCRHLPNIFPGKKTQNENPHFKRFSGILPIFFAGIVGEARYKNRNTKKHASTSSKIFPEKKNIKGKIQL